jgi:hypothetical protein
MRLLLLMSGFCIGILCIGNRAEAQNYPWCSQYSEGGEGGRNCGFTTFQQCLENVSGMVAFANATRCISPRPDHIR